MLETELEQHVNDKITFVVHALLRHIRCGSIFTRCAFVGPCYLLL